MPISKLPQIIATRQMQPGDGHHQCGLKTPIDSAVFTIIDIETTGLNPNTEELTEVVARRYKNGRQLAEFATLVNPGRAISPFIEKLTGITSNMVRNAPSPKQVLERLALFVGPNPILVADGIGFEAQHLPAAFKRHGLPHLARRFVLNNRFCTRVLARQNFPVSGVPDVRAAKVGKLLGLPVQRDHRAGNDVDNAARVFFALIECMRKNGWQMETLADLKTIQQTPSEYHLTPSPVETRKFRQR